MAFESRIESAASTKTDFNGAPSCKCGRPSIIALATVANINTGKISVGAASEFCGRDKEKRPNRILQDRYALQSFDGYCAGCWEGRGVEGKRTYTDEIVREAWMWFIGYIAKDSETMSGIFNQGGDIPIEDQERYVEVVNREAKRCNNHNAIPDEYKLAEVWG